MTIDPYLVRKAKERLSHARMMASRKAPYMRTAIYALVPVPTEDMPQGMAVTDKGHLIFDPTVVLEKWSVEDCATGYVHEAEHILRHHFKRHSELDVETMTKHVELWRIGSDAEINDDLLAMKFKMLDTDILPSKFGAPNGKTAEWYVEFLKKPGQGTPQKKPCGCGSGAGSPVPAEAKLKAEGGLPDLGGDRPARLEKMRDNVAGEITAAAAQGRAPAGLVRWAAERTAVKPISWETKLQVLTQQALTRSAGETDHTYAKFSRRQAGVGFGPGKPVIPALYAPTPVVALVQDTSGSMGEAEFSKTLEHAKDILQHCGGDLIFVSCDAKVHALRKVSSVDQIKKSLLGGGGTDFRPAFDALAKLSPRPNIVVFATDAEGTFPSTRPSWCHTIWLVSKVNAYWGGGVGRYAATPWGDRIEVG